MAWMSAGSSNADLCEQLCRFGVLDDERVKRAFLATDRGDFVPQERRAEAYIDAPFKMGPIHLSAPHMYVQVLKALDLRRGASFLNIGSGTGYLSCLAACLLGEQGVSHGVEISPEVCSFSEQAIARWKERLRERERETCAGTVLSQAHTAVQHASTQAADTKPSSSSSDHINDNHNGHNTNNNNHHDGNNNNITSTLITPTHSSPTHTRTEPEREPTRLLDFSVDEIESVQVVCGNAFSLDLRRCIAGCRYERIYIGAACPLRCLHFFLHLLSPREGKLIVPVSERHELVCVVRHAESVFSSQAISRVHYAPLLDAHLCPPLRTQPHSTAAAAAAAAVAAAATSAAAHSLSDSEVTESEEEASLSVTQILSRVARSPFLPVPLPVSNHTPETPDTRNVHSQEAEPLQLPVLLWAPRRQRHRQFPNVFRECVRTLLMASNRSLSLSLSSSSSSSCVCGRKREKALCAMLPTDLWLQIFTFMSRDWFSQHPSELETVRAELVVERERRAETEARLREVQKHRDMLLREREILQALLVRRGLPVSAQRLALAYSFPVGDGESEEDEDLHTAASSEEEHVHFPSLSEEEEEVEEQADARHPLFPYEREEDEETDDEGVQEVNTHEDAGNDVRMEEDEESFLVAVADSVSRQAQAIFIPLRHSRSTSVLVADSSSDSVPMVLQSVEETTRESAMSES